MSRRARKKVPPKARPRSNTTCIWCDRKGATAAHPKLGPMHGACLEQANDWLEATK